MKTLKNLLLSSMLLIFGLTNLSIFSVVHASDNPENENKNQNIYNEVLNQTTSRLPGTINGGDVVTDATGADMFNKQVMNLIGYIIDIFIVIGIALAFIGGYKIMTSDKEDALKGGIRLIIFGVLGIIIMVSARFLAEGLVGSGGIITSEFSQISNEDQPSGINFASALYEKILYPFIKIALYFVVGFLFFMMVGKVIGYVTSTDDSVKKKAGGVIIWCVVGILIVMGSKQLVESVMGNQNDVINKNAKRISDQTPGSVLNFGSIPIVTQIINWVMGLTMFIVLVLIIVQGYKMFTKPDDPKNRESLKKTLLYIIIGVLVIGAAYAISSVLVINNVPIVSE